VIKKFTTYLEDAVISSANSISFRRLAFPAICLRAALAINAETDGGGKTNNKI